MGDIHIAQVRIDDVAYRQVYDLREELLRKPLGLSLANEDLSSEADQITLAAFSGETVIACLMLQKKEEGVLKLRQMVVAQNVQGTGVGRLLVQAAETWAKEHDYHQIMLHARREAMGFYRKLGYRQEGDEFTEVGIPHFLMVKERL